MGSLRGRYRQLARVLRLKARLDGCQVRPSIEALAQELKVTTRTVRRDLDALRIVGYAVPPPAAKEINADVHGHIERPAQRRG